MANADMTINYKLGTVKCLRVYSQSGKILEESERNDEITLPAMDGPTATVSLDKSLSKNLGDYNNAKVSVFVSVPAYLDAEEIDRALLFCKQTVEKTLIENLNEFVEFLKQRYPSLMKNLK